MFLVELEKGKSEEEAVRMIPSCKSFSLVDQPKKKMSCSCGKEHISMQKSTKVRLVKLETMMTRTLHLLKGMAGSAQVQKQRDDYKAHMMGE